MHRHSSSEKQKLEENLIVEPAQLTKELSWLDCESEFFSGDLFAVFVEGFHRLRPVLIVPNLLTILLAVHIGGYTILRSACVVVNLRTIYFAVNIGGYFGLRAIRVGQKRRASEWLGLTLNI